MNEVDVILREILQEAYEVNYYSLADPDGAIQQDIDKIKKLFAPNKVDIKPEELDAAIAVIESFKV